jgi:type I restriction enzyme M protein
MAHDGFSLDDKRQPTAENDIADILTCWRDRHNAEFQAERGATLEELRDQVAPLKAERLRLLGEINRLTFESTIAPEEEDLTGFGKPVRSELEEVEQELAALEGEIAPVQAQIDQLTRQFWVEKAQVKANKYDLSASRYRQVEPEEAYYEKPQVTMERLLKLEQVMAHEIRRLETQLQ